jgi:uncharacterized membrane protein
MTQRWRFLLNRLRERLWIKPLAACLLSVVGIAIARATDGLNAGGIVPLISEDALQTLLSIMAASMLVIATFAVAAMVSAYSSASATATPRAFPLVISDDVSQTALSAFVGAFIFSVVALTALKSGLFEATGRFTVFVFTASAFAFVILTFVRWVDRIARLGRLGAVIDTVERAAAASLRRRSKAALLGGAPVSADAAAGVEVTSPRVGYVQHINVAALQDYATALGARIVVGALPGTFVAPGRKLAEVVFTGASGDAVDGERVAAAFEVGGERVFDDDPRFGVVVLSEIASRALSPAVNDAGTAIDIVGTLVRLFVDWHSDSSSGGGETIYDRVEVPALTLDDMFEDAFMAISRDGAAMREVAVRLQKGLAALASLGDPQMRQAALRMSKTGLARCAKAMQLPEDVAAVQKAAPASALSLAAEKQH